MAIVQANDLTFEKEIQEGVVLVDLFATWCGPCKMLSPVLEEVAKELEGKVKVVKVDVDESPETASKLEVMSVPTLIVYKNGEMKTIFYGYQPKEAIMARIQSHLS